MRQVVWSLLSIGIFLGSSCDIFAQVSRDQVITHLTEQYGASEAVRLYEEMQVRNALEAFARRVNFRDVKSLVGLLEGDLAQPILRGKQAKQSSMSEMVQEHWGSPQKREFITTATKDYTVEERMLLRSDLLELFLKLSPNVRFDFKVDRIELAGHSATAEINWAFKVREVETPKTRALAIRAPSPLVLRLVKDGDQWLVTDLKNITTQIASVVAN